MGSNIVKNTLISTVVAGMLVGCGGGGGGINTSSETTTLKGKAIDGYIKGSRVFLDLDLNGAFTTGLEPFDITDDNGSYSISLTTEQKNHENFNIAPLVAVGGIDTDTNQAFEGKLEAPNSGGDTNLTPMTTVVSKMVKGEDLSGKTEEQIKQIIDSKKETLKTVLGVSEGTDIDADFISSANKELNKVALQIQKTVELITTALDNGTTSESDIQDKVVETLAKKVEKLKNDNTADLAKVVEETRLETEDTNSELRKLTGVVLTTNVTSNIEKISDNIDAAFENMETEGDSFEDLVEKVIIVVENQTSKLEEAIENEEDLSNIVETLDQNSEIFTKTKDELREIGIKNELDLLRVSGDTAAVAAALVAITDPIIEFNNFYEVINSDFIEEYPQYEEILNKINERKVKQVSISNIKVKQSNSVELSFNELFYNIDGYESFTYTVEGLPAWITNDVENKKLVLTNPSNSNVGIYNYTLTVNNGNSVLGTKKIFVEVLNVNDAPTLSNEIADASINEDDNTLSIDVKPHFADVDANDELTFDVTLEDGTLLPSWLGFENGILTATPTDINVGTHSLKVTATDKKGEKVSDIFTLTVNNVNDAPTVKTAIADTAAEQTVEFTLDIKSNFEDVDTDSGDVLIYAATLEGGASLPSWLSFENGVFNGTPGNADITTTPLSIVVTASDSENLEVSDIFTLDVRDKNDAPVVSVSVIDSQFQEDQETNIDLNDYFSDIDTNDELTFTSKEGTTLPSWITLTGSTLSILAGNDNVGDTEVSITATDKLGLSVSHTFTISVENTNDAPTSSNQSFTLNSSESLTLNGTLTGNDVDTNDTITFELSQPISGGILTLNPDGTFTYTTDEGFIGTDTFAFKVKDSNGEYSSEYSASITVSDGSTPLNADVDAAIKKLESIDPEIENIDTKLDEAKALLDGNTTPEAKIVSLMIDTAEILNDSTITPLVEYDTTSLDGTTQLNRLIRSMTSDVITADVPDNITNLSSVSMDRLNNVADELMKISDEFGNLFTSSEDVYSYDGETMNYNESLELRAGLLALSAQFKQWASYQWIADSDIEIKEKDIGGTIYEYSTVDVDPASIFNNQNVYKLTSAASSRLPDAKANLIASIDLLLDLPVGHGADENDPSDEGLTADDKADMEAVKLSLSDTNGSNPYVIDIEDDDEIKQVKIDLSKLFDASTALDVTSIGTSWQNLCEEGIMVSSEQAIIRGNLECKVLDWYDSFNDTSYYYYEEVQVEPQLVPTADNSKIDNIILNMTKIDNTVLSGQDMMDFMFKDDDIYFDGFGDKKWKNQKKDERYLVSGNDVKVDEDTGTYIINAYKKENTDSRAEAARYFSTAKSEITAFMRLKDVDTASDNINDGGPVSRGAMNSSMENVNASGDNIWSTLEFRDGSIKYRVYKYDSNWENEMQIASGTIASGIVTVIEDASTGKFKGSISIDGADIKFNVSKVDGSGSEVESYTEKTVSVTGATDLGIDGVQFRASMRTNGDRAYLYDEVTKPTQFRVHSFEAVTPAELATLSTGDIAILAGSDDWYDIMSVDTDSITLDMYDKNSSGTFAYNESETIKTEFLTGSTLNILDNANSIEEFIEIKNTIAVSGYTDLFKSDLVFTIKKETVDTNTWDWNDHGATSVQELETVFTNGYTYFGGDDTFMLKPSGVVVKAVLTGSDEYGDNYTYGDIINSASWETIGNQIVVDLSTDYKVKFAFELNQYNKIVETETLLVGYQGSDYIYTGSDALQFFQDETGINPSN